MPEHDLHITKMMIYAPQTDARVKGFNSPGESDSLTRLCGMARIADPDEERSCRRWRESKGGH